MPGVRKLAAVFPGVPYGFDMAGESSAGGSSVLGSVAPISLSGSSGSYYPPGVGSSGSVGVLPGSESVPAPVTDATNWSQLLWGPSRDVVVAGVVSSVTPNNARSNHVTIALIGARTIVGAESVGTSGVVVAGRPARANIAITVANTAPNIPFFADLSIRSSPRSNDPSLFKHSIVNAINGTYNVPYTPPSHAALVPYNTSVFLNLLVYFVPGTGSQTVSVTYTITNL
jgi:hypothetical protein